MISGSSVVRKYIAWYDFRILCHKNVYTHVSLTLSLSCGCLRMCFYISWQHFSNMMSPAQMTITARTASEICARTRSECPEIFVFDLISWENSGIIEPWSECQPEESRLERVFLRKQFQGGSEVQFEPAIAKHYDVKGLVIGTLDIEYVQHTGQMGRNGSWPQWAQCAKLGPRPRCTEWAQTGPNGTDVGPTPGS